MKIKATEENTSIQTEEPMATLKELSKMTMEDKPLRSTAAPIMPIRRVERNKSGGLPGARVGGRRAPPNRSQSHKIGRPVFNKDLSAEPVRGMARNTSGRLRGATKTPRATPTRGAPSRSRSFGRAVPNRASSSNSLKVRRPQTAGQVDIPDGDSVCDSVFTSASNQTLDSIMVRKSQIISGVAGVASAAGMRKPRDDTSITSFDFDDESLHTVDSIMLNHRHQTEHYDDDDQGDLSVFSESFASTDTYDLSDYEDEEGLIKEVEIESDLEEDHGEVEERKEEQTTKE